MAKTDIITITQEQLNKTPERDRRWRWPGVNGPGTYTWDEAGNTFRPVESISDSDDSAILGIGGIGIFEENELPVIPSARAMARIEKLEKTDIICRKCGASQNFDGAMFTTSGGNICDDCF